MIRINLLPYRNARRQAQILEHLAWFFGAVSIVTVLLILVNIYGNSELSDLKGEFTQLQAQNNELRKKIGKLKDLDNLRADVERKLALVDELQQGRFESLNVLAGLSNAIPENVWLTSMQDASGKLKLSGVAESNKAVANFMRALEQSEKFENIALKVSSRTSVGGVSVRTFDMTLNRRADALKGGKK